MSADETTRQCIYCKGTMELELLRYTVSRGGEELVLEDVPTWVCTRCEETVVDDEVGEAVEDLLEQLEYGFPEEEE